MHYLPSLKTSKQTPKKPEIPEQIALQSNDPNIFIICPVASNFRERLFILQSQEWYSSLFLSNKDFLVVAWLEFSEALLQSLCKHLHKGFYIHSEIPHSCTGTGKFWWWHFNILQYFKRLGMGTLSDTMSKGQKTEFVNALQMKWPKSEHLKANFKM